MESYRGYLTDVRMWAPNVCIERTTIHVLEFLNMLLDGNVSLSVSQTLDPDLNISSAIGLIALNFWADSNGPRWLNSTDFVCAIIRLASVVQSELS